MTNWPEITIYRLSQTDVSEIFKRRLVAFKFATATACAETNLDILNGCCS